MTPAEKHYQTYMHTTAWHKKAKRRRELDGNVCQVCGKEAEEVHHLTYMRTGSEEIEDLISLCKRCHAKAEEIADLEPKAMQNGVILPMDTFMAAVRVDASRIAPVVLDYLKSLYGDNVATLLRLKLPGDKDPPIYWQRLHRAVFVLCNKRYWRCCMADRADIVLRAISNRVVTVALSQIEHEVRNGIQGQLCIKTNERKAELGKAGTWKKIAAEIGISTSQLYNIRQDKGDSWGPTLRETILFYLGQDAVMGIPPISGFDCLTEEDYRRLADLANYMTEVSEQEYLLS